MEEQGEATGSGEGRGGKGVLPAPDPLTVAADLKGTGLRCTSV